MTMFGYLMHLDFEYQRQTNAPKSWSVLGDIVV
uniref:Uncharacterized protein n=1 Tax=Rhizophora mucronata TaxID=61149 RepID=A0A2P2Q2B9_RHIMU